MGSKNINSQKFWQSEFPFSTFASKIGISIGLIAILLILASPAGYAAVQYVYDEADRLVEVVDTNGNGAVYRYDNADNLSSIRRFAPGDLVIAEFTPDRGPEGTIVTIYGAGFSATDSNNTVRFNGAVATLTRVSPTKLVAQVPIGATTGPISVTVGAQTATSASPFTVTTNSVNLPPVITGFNPKIGFFGTPVTIEGQNFEPTPGSSIVQLNNSRAEVASSSLTQINTTVPTGATSGSIKVRTPYGSAATRDDFFVVP